LERAGEPIADQVGIVALLNGRAEGIHVEMGDDSEHDGGRLTNGPFRAKTRTTDQPPCPHLPVDLFAIRE